MVALLCISVFAQSATFTSQHLEHDDQGCLLCHVGTQPLLPSAVSGRFTPVFQTVWLAPLAYTPAVPSVAPQHKTSRAPPSA